MVHCATFITTNFGGKKPNERFERTKKRETRKKANDIYKYNHETNQIAPNVFRTSKKEMLDDFLLL